MQISRRKLFTLGAGAGAALIIGSPAIVRAATIRTPAPILGPDPLWHLCARRDLSKMPRDEIAARIGSWDWKALSAPECTRGCANHYESHRKSHAWFSPPPYKGACNPYCWHGCPACPSAGHPLKGVTYEPRYRIGAGDYSGCICT